MRDHFKLRIDYLHDNQFKTQLGIEQKERREKEERKKEIKKERTKERKKERLKEKKERLQYRKKEKETNRHLISDCLHGNQYKNNSM